MSCSDADHLYAVARPQDKMKSKKQLINMQQWNHHLPIQFAMIFWHAEVCVWHFWRIILVGRSSSTTNDVPRLTKIKNKNKKNKPWCKAKIKKKVCFP